MSRKRQRPSGSVDEDGVRVVSTRGWWPMIIAIGLSAVVILVVMIRFMLGLDEPGPAEVRVRSEHTETHHPRARPPVPRMRLVAVERGATPPSPAPASTPIPDKPVPDATVVEPTAEPGEAAAVDDEPVPDEADPNAPSIEPDLPPPPPQSDYGWEGPAGIALFPPPGTNPPKPGIIVPEDYELPEGYVRHHQTTDDGRSLKPILTFHPDYDLYDEHGNRIEIPEDRVVPPELAPPDLPIEILEIPETVYPDDPSPEEMEELQRIVDENPELLDKIR